MWKFQELILQGILQNRLSNFLPGTLQKNYAMFNFYRHIQEKINRILEIDEKSP